MWRFLRFVVVSMVGGFALSIAIDRLVPGGPSAIHPRLMFGAGASLAAIAVAWSKLNAHQTVRLFFVVPVTGKHFFWITVGFCVLGLIYPLGVPEGVASPFGGVIVGLLLGGTPSLL